MKPQAPVLDIFIGRDHDAWRLYVAPTSSPALLWLRLDENREIYPIGRPDAADLDRFMFDTDSPYEHRVSSDGGIQIVAKGRSAVTLLVWLEELMPPPNRAA